MRTFVMPSLSTFFTKIALLLAFLSLALYAEAQVAAIPGVAVKIDTAVNSKFEEIMPLLAPDGKTLFFVRSLSPANTGGKEAGQDVWFSTRKADGRWTSPENLGMPVNNMANNAICGISKDGNTIYLTNIYERKMKMEPGISSSTKTSEGKWSQPIPLKITDFVIQRGYLGAYMCPDEKTLFLTMKSDDAVGREDLYVSFKAADGVFSKPASLGKAINTVGFEISPYYVEKDSMLYFASNGHGGQGDADIFRTKRLDDTWTNWTKPENMGPQTNSDGFDAYLAISADSSAFFVKEDPELRFADIYTVKIEDPKINKAKAENALAGGKKTGKDGKKGKGSGEEDEDEEKKKNRLTDKDDRSAEEIYRDLAARQRAQNKDFESILFDFGKSTLRPEGKKILDKAVKFLKSNPNVGIELVGHTDSISGDLVNQILSDKRSYAAKEYLLKRGISRNRILNHGFGKQIFVRDNESEDSRQQNRRCELNLLMTTEQFEAYKNTFRNTSTVIPAAPSPAEKPK